MEYNISIKINADIKFIECLLSNTDWKVLSKDSILYMDRLGKKIPGYHEICMQFLKDSNIALIQSTSLRIFQQTLNWQHLHVLRLWIPTKSYYN